jgi:hypothetical protein
LFHTADSLESGDRYISEKVYSSNPILCLAGHSNVIYSVLFLPPIHFYKGQSTLHVIVGLTGCEFVCLYNIIEATAYSTVGVENDEFEKSGVDRVHVYVILYYILSYFVVY